MTREEAIALLNQDFSAFPRHILEDMEHALGTANGAISCRRYTLPGDCQRVREAIRNDLLAESATARSYLAPDALFSPASIGTTGEALEALAQYYDRLAAQITL